MKHNLLKYNMLICKINAIQGLEFYRIKGYNSENALIISKVDKILLDLLRERLEMNLNCFVISKIEHIYTGVIWPNHPSAPISPRKNHVIAVIVNGELNSTLNGHSVIVKENEVLYLSPGVMDTSTSNQGCKYITIEFSTVMGEYASPIHAKLVSNLNADTGNSIQEKFKAILKTWISDKPDKKLKCFEIAYSILSLLTDDFGTNAEKMFRYSKLAPAIEYINEHCLDPDFQISHLERVCKMSGVHLNRLFRELYNTSASGYAMNKRIDAAKVMLLNSQNSVGDVGIQCGWSDIYTFSHAFKRATKLSPSEWREKSEDDAVPECH